MGHRGTSRRSSGINSRKICTRREDFSAPSVLLATPRVRGVEAAPRRIIHRAAVKMLWVRCQQLRLVDASLVPPF